MKKIFVILTFLLALYYPVSAQELTRQRPIRVNCGEEVESEFTANFEEHSYVINLEPGSTIDVSVSPFGQGLQTTIAVYGPTNLALGGSGGNVGSNGSMGGSDTSEAPSVTVGPLASRGEHTIRVTNFSFWGYDVFRNQYNLASARGIGFYAILVTCTLRGNPIPSTSPTPPNPPPLPTKEETITRGFPGVNPVDFSGVDFEISLELGSSQTAFIGGDAIALYAYTATADERRSLNISRTGGNISIGIAVIQDETNEIIFLGGMPFSDNLTVELIFPEDGAYLIGLFTLNTPTLSGTSGAVQITIE